MIFLDSSVLIDYFNGNENWQVQYLHQTLGIEITVIGDYVLTEVLQGFRKNKDFEQAKTVLRNFPCYNICGEKIAMKSAENYRFLRKKGITIRKSIDGIIATFCIENNFILLHNNKDFIPFEKHLGLKSIKMQ